MIRAVIFDLDGTIVETEPIHFAALIERKSSVYQAMVAERDVLYPGAEKFVRDCAQRFPLMSIHGLDLDDVLRALRGH